ncbi:MAG: 2,5-diamino-6-(ribosylamino)-4(3H)-pyrimidinone 5'-phosphate reductase [Thermoplasmata archaeon]|nr:2,5-diamino-6-(ribosylamino)-4(3H)-pyrimidinone 5'-phosphate reductase [Thermoplasmata archaeon]
MKVILNCAMSADGKIALPTRRQTRISNPEDLERVHRLRNGVDAILVGIGTILADDPKLTVSEKYISEPSHPLRIVLDSKGRTPPSAEVLKGDAKTLIVTAENCSKEFPGAKVVRLGEDRVDIHRLLDFLSSNGIKNLLVEGGGEVMWSFLNRGLADEISIFVGSMIIGGSDSPTLASGEGADSLDNIRRLALKDCERLGDGVLLRYEVLK